MWSRVSGAQVVPILVFSLRVLLFQLKLDITSEMAFVTTDGIQSSLKAMGTFACSICPLGLKTFSVFSLILLRCRNILGESNKTLVSDQF